ncbi:hypothetical protein [Xenorhabdus bharatensis]|uniref:hypothetical protein n=1 Tax=Xenorhabdus bharatensis TaxID=3136256 RepID=UPI0030F41D10
MENHTTLSIINGTNTDLKLIKSEQYQMTVWHFPEIISANKGIEIYIQRKNWFFDDTTLDRGVVEYHLLDSNESSFQIIASCHRDSDQFLLSAHFKHLIMDENLSGSELILGWNPDTTVTFIITGTENKYTGTGMNTSSWMCDNREILGKLSLKNLSIPGSHDAGMSIYTSGTAFATDCNTLTQTHDILGQLNLGIRYFDIRPVISGGHFLTGHYSHLVVTWQGANGESIQSIVDAINQFNKAHNELIIIQLSHSLNTDLGNNSYREFTKEEWDRLFIALDNIDYLYCTDEDLSLITFNQFTNNGTHPAVLFIVKGAHANLGTRYKNGFFYLNDLNIYDKYSNTEDFDKMSEDQIHKMENYSDKTYFLLSWTLTQNALTASTCKISTRIYHINSIKELGTYANQYLPIKLYDKLSSDIYPNIIHVDNVKDTNIAALTVATNYKVHSN